MIQMFEFWTRQPDGTVTGTLLKQVTARINEGFANIIPLLLSYSDNVRWDDINHTDRPIGTIDLTSGQADYTVTADGSSLDILNITDVRILLSASGTEYETLKKMSIDDERALDAMSPNPSVSGVPEYWLENGNNIFLYPEPNYSATAGIKLFFQREQDYFVSTDTTQEPGIPKPFHELPVLYASLDWIMANRPEDGNTISRLEARIAKKERDLWNFIAMRNPTRSNLSVKERSFR